MLGRDFEDEVWTRFVFELVIWPNRLLWKDELNPRVRCAFGNVFDGMTLIRTLDSQFSWIFDIFEKVAMETFTIRIAQVLWRYARRKDDIFKAFLSERLPLASLHRAKPGATFAVLYQAILGVEGLLAPSPPAGKFLLLPVLVEPVRKEKLLIVFVNSDLMCFKTWRRHKEGEMDYGDFCVLKSEYYAEATTHLALCSELMCLRKAKLSRPRYSHIEQM